MVTQSEQLMNSADGRWTSGLTQEEVKSIFHVFELYPRDTCDPLTQSFKRNFCFCEDLLVSMALTWNANMACIQYNRPVEIMLYSGFMKGEKEGQLVNFHLIGAREMD